MQGVSWAFLRYLVKPRVSVDSTYELVLRWGENILQVPPGRHHLQIWYKTSWLSRAYYISRPSNVGNIVVDVPEGQIVQLVYKTRWVMFLPGNVEIIASS